MPLNAARAASGIWKEGDAGIRRSLVEDELLLSALSDKQAKNIIVMKDEGSV